MQVIIIKTQGFAILFIFVTKSTVFIITIQSPLQSAHKSRIDGKVDWEGKNKVSLTELYCMSSQYTKHTIKHRALILMW